MIDNVKFLSLKFQSRMWSHSKTVSADSMAILQQLLRKRLTTVQGSVSCLQ